MDEVGRLGCDGNIWCFADQLRWERDPARQEKLKQLLIQEENRFDATEERLRVVEHKLADGAELITRQRRLIAEMKIGDGDTASAERTLRTFETIQDLFERLRDLKHDGRARRHP